MIPLLIVIATLIVYNPVMNNGILHGWDDTEYLLDEGVQDFNVGDIFSSYHLGMYQPLSVTSLALNFSSAASGPRAYHATNIFLHIVNIILIWLFLLMLTRKRLIAGIGALLFAIHPLNVEAVAWIAARSTLLFAAFYLAGLISYLQYTKNKKGLYFGLTIAFATLSLFSKSLAISFPLVLLAIDYFQDRKWNIKLLIEKIPFFALSVIFGIITVDAAQAYGHISALQYDYSLPDRFFILWHTYVFYLVKFIVPINLSSIYAYPDMANGSLPIMYYLSTLIPIGMLYFIYRYWNKRRALISGILIFSFSIAPVLPLFWSRVFVAADRYAYLSFIGLYLIAAILIERLLKNRFLKQDILRYGLIVAFAAYGIFLMYSNREQSKYWIDGDTLLSRAVTLSKSGPEKALAHFYRGNIRQNIAENKYTQGQASSNEGMIKNSFIYYREAVSDYDSVIKYNPDYMLVYSNRGMIYGTLSTYDKSYWELARDDFDKAIILDPEYADNYYNKGWLLFIRGEKETACSLWQTAKEKGSVVAENALDQNCR